MEQLEPDFREVERARELPPDEPYGDREADYWDAEPELERIATYGACAVCGRGRIVRDEIQGTTRRTSLVCPEGHPQP